MEREESRTFLGVAKDLLVRLVERGLNLPDASDRREGGKRLELRASPLPTVTLAEIYLAQGHRERALETLRSVLVRNPSDAQASSLYDRLSSGEVQVPPPKLKPEGNDEAVAAAPAEPRALTVTSPQAGAYCEAVKMVDGRVLIKWSTDREIEGAFALQIVCIRATWSGPETTQTILAVGREGSHELAADAHTIVRVALGLVAETDHFQPLAHSPEIEKDESGSLYVWTQRGRELASTSAAALRP